MPESSNDAERRESKRSKMRQSLDSSFNDPLQNFTIPAAIRNISEAFENKAAELEGRIRQISASSNEEVSDEPEQIRLYIEQRQELVEDIAIHLKEARNIIRSDDTSFSPDQRRNKLKRALSEIDKTDRILLRERAALASDRIRIEYGVRSHAKDVKIGEAYMMAITENFPEPAESSYDRKHGRSRTDQTSFRKRLIKAYNTDGSTILNDSPDYQSIWCPISEKRLGGTYMKAAHIVPHSIGEGNAAYLFGCKISEGYDILWSERNGLMLNSTLEKYFDDGRMVIVPDPNVKDEFMSFILSQELLRFSQPDPLIGAPISTLHGKRLRFQTHARPDKRFLYIHALLSVFRRRRFNVPGWERDHELIFTGEIWEKPGKWARRSMVEAMAIEMGDRWPEIDKVEGLGEFPRPMSPEEERRAALDINYNITNRDREMEDEDEY